MSAREDVEALAVALDDLGQAVAEALRPPLEWLARHPWALAVWALLGLAVWGLSEASW